jgi:hypothetical protein
MTNRLVAFVARHKFYFLAFFIYLILAFLRFPQITLNVAKVVPGANGDTYFNLWGFWWVDYALFNLHQSIFHTALLFWPVGANLVYQTMSPIGSFIFGPLQVVSLPFAYNMFFFFGFAFTGIGMFVLANYFIKEKYSAFLAGLIFAFGTFHVMQAYTHIDWVYMGWVPLSLYFFIRLIKEDKFYFNAFGLSASFVLTLFMGDLEQGIMVLILFVLVLVLYAINLNTRKKVLNISLLKKIGFALLIILVLGSWAFVPIAQTLFSPTGTGNSNPLSIVNQINTLQFNEENSMSVLSFFLPAFYNGIVPNSIFLEYYRTVFSPNNISSIERTGYITYTVIALILFGIYKSRKEVKLWIAIAIIFGLLSLGPYVQLAHNSTGIPGLYQIYHSLPLLNIIREPGRFSLVLFIALSIIAAYGFKSFVEYAEKLKLQKIFTKKYTWLILISILFLIETSGLPISNSSTILPVNTAPTIPEFYYLLRNTSGNFSVLQLPALPNSGALPDFYLTEASYYTSASHKPILSGSITRATFINNEYLYDIPLVIEAGNLENYGVPYYTSPVNENYTAQSLFNLYNYQTLFVVLNKNAYNANIDTYLYSQLSSIFGQPVYNDGSTVAFSTSAAINNSIFRNFVELPAIGQWMPVSFNYVGENLTLWYPIGEGSVAVYAPYQNSSDIPYDIKHDVSYTENATLKFDAVGTGRYNQLGIFEQVGESKPVQITEINVSNKLSTYSVNLHGLVVGTLGNSLFFVTSRNSQYSKENNASDVLIGNITLSRS